MSPDDPWALAGACAVLATMHGKTAAVVPALKLLGLAWVELPPGFDTDRFGTFTRDVPRAGSQLEAARAKAEAALAEVPEARVAIASEGAFGPHPHMPFLPGGRELVLLIDRLTGLELVGYDLTLETNHAQELVSGPGAALAFARRIGFPDHGLMLMSFNGHRLLARDFVGEAELLAAVAPGFAERGRVWLEADMRAHRNPTRMAAISCRSRYFI